LPAEVSHRFYFSICPSFFATALTWYWFITTQIDIFPNATVAEYGQIPFEDDSDPDYDVVKAIKSEIFARGPVAATINAEPIVEYQGGVFTDDSHSQQTNHIVSIVGWGQFSDSDTDSGDDAKKTYWIIRNRFVLLTVFLVENSMYLANRDN
jgi:cathepsin X